MSSSVPVPFFTAPTGGGAPRLLLISYHFPPGSTAGSLRWQKLARHAADRGWSLDVIALAPDDVVNADPGRLADLPVGTRVFGVPAKRPRLDRAAESAWIIARRLRPQRSLTTSSGGTKPTDPASLSRAEMLRGIRSLRDLKSAYHAWRVVAGDRAWAGNAEEVALRLAVHHRYEAIITCGPPHMVHEAGRRVARRTGIPLVVDMRDPWSLVERLPASIASPVWLRLAAGYEAPVMREASLIVANTGPARDALHALYPHVANRVVAVMNGYDEEILPRAESRNRFVVAYAGTVYLDRNPRGLFRAAAEVVRDLELTPDQFGIELMGHVEGLDGLPLEMIAEQEGISDFFRLHAPAPRNQALEFLAGASLLVSLPQDSDMAIPSKVFEYLQFEAWTLALASRSSATGMALQQSDADVVLPHDVAGMATVIRKRFLQFRAGEKPQPAPAGGPLSRAAQATIFFDTLEQVLFQRAGVGAAARRPGPAQLAERGTHSEGTPAGSRGHDV